MAPMACLRGDSAATSLCEEDVMPSAILGESHQAMCIPAGREVLFAGGAASFGVACRLLEWFVGSWLTSTFAVPSLLYFYRLSADYPSHYMVMAWVTPWVMPKG